MSKWLLRELQEHHIPTVYEVTESESEGSADGGDKPAEDARTSIDCCETDVAQTLCDIHRRVPGWHHTPTWI